mgnify:CR=1 FL=1
MDRDEPPIFGIKVWLGKKQFQITDELGYFKFEKARGKIAYVTLDTGSLPAGYMLTVPVLSRFLLLMLLDRKFILV